MAYDKVIDSAQLDAAITATANAIREKTGDTALIEWLADKGFEEAIAAIEAGELPSGISKIATGTYTLSSDAGQNFQISHGMKAVPKWAIVWTEDAAAAPIGFAALSTIYSSLGAGLHAKKSQGALAWNSLSNAWTKNGCLNNLTIKPTLSSSGTSAYAGTTFKWVAWI